MIFNKTESDVSRREAGFRRIQEHTSDRLRSAEIHEQLGDSAISLAELVENAEPVGVIRGFRGGRLDLPPHLDANIPQVLIYEKQEADQRVRWRTRVDIEKPNGDTVPRNARGRSAIAVEGDGQGLGVLHGVGAGNTIVPTYVALGDLGVAGHDINLPSAMFAHEIRHWADTVESNTNEFRGAATDSTLQEGFITRMEVDAHQVSAAMTGRTDKIRQAEHWMRSIIASGAEANLSPYETGELLRGEVEFVQQVRGVSAEFLDMVHASASVLSELYDQDDSVVPPQELVDAYKGARLAL